MRNVPISKTAAIFVHGLWLTGAESALLRRRITASHGFHCHSFSYRTVGSSVQPVLAKLAEFVSRIDADRVHFVGHSLGGIVILRALELGGSLPPGRAVLLGSPLQGSCAAQGITRLLPFGRAILGMSINEECIEHRPRIWTGEREVGVIAGSSRLGLGRLFATMEGEHDGTVLVSETQLPGAKDHLVLPASHSSMVFSSEVANQTVHFLKHGTFLR